MGMNALVLWMIQMAKSLKRAGFLTIGAGGRVRLADWVLADIFDRDMDFDDVISFLGGDEHFARNKNDIARLERRAGRPITQLWDTDSIFLSFPHLRGFARNWEFENVIWPRVKDSWRREK